LISKKKKIHKNLFNKKKFQIDFKSETKYSPKYPKPETRGIGFSFPDSPNPQGMKIAGELASLLLGIRKAQSYVLREN
jgi:hypothetical protein